MGVGGVESLIKQDGAEVGLVCAWSCLQWGASVMMSVGWR